MSANEYYHDNVINYQVDNDLVEGKTAIIEMFRSEFGY